MLQKLNERIQGVVAWVVIILVAVTFTLFGVDYYMQSHRDSNVQLEVNGQPVTKEAFELNYRRARQMRDPAQMTAAFEKQLKQQVVDEMVVNLASVQAAAANGFEVGPEQANAAILNIPQFQQDGHFSADRYQQALSGALFTPESFQKEVRQGMLLNQQRFAFIGTAFALPNEIKQFVRLYMQTRDYDYLQIPAATFMKEANISDAEATAYYQKHQSEFVSPETVNIDFIRLSMNAIKEKIKVSDEQVNRYYEENKSNFLTPAQWQVAHILFVVPANAPLAEEERIKQRAEEVYLTLQKSPDEFAQNVKTFSDDKASVAAGGVLPWITAGQTELDKALIHLTKPGHILHPIKSKQGYEIFKLVAYKPAATKPLADVKASIQQQIVADEAQATYADALEKISDLSYQTPDSLKPVSKALHMKIETSAPFSRQGGRDDFTKHKQVLNAAFSHDILELGNNSEPIQLDNETVIVLRIHERFPSAMKTIDEAKPMIVKKLAQLKAKHEARSLGKQILALEGKPDDQEQKLKQAKGLTWQNIMRATRDTDMAPLIVNETAFNLPRIGASVGRGVMNGDYVIVRLNKINEGQILTLDKEQVASITQQIEANYGMMDYDLYVSSILSKATIVKH